MMRIGPPQPPGSRLGEETAERGLSSSPRTHHKPLVPKPLPANSASQLLCWPKFQPCRRGTQKSGHLREGSLKFLKNGLVQPGTVTDLSSQKAEVGRAPHLGTSKPDSVPSDFTVRPWASYSPSLSRSLGKCPKAHGKLSAQRLAHGWCSVYGNSLCCSPKLQPPFSQWISEAADKIKPDLGPHP